MHIEHTESSELIAAHIWAARVGITATTVWRWTKRGWLMPINIAGRLYLSRKNLEEFQARAEAGEFMRENRLPELAKVRAA